MWLQEKIQLELRNQDFHLIIEEVLGNQLVLKSAKQGLARFHSQYTSASLSLNESADSSVRKYMGSHFNQLVAEDTFCCEHMYEGLDDMPAILHLNCWLWNGFCPLLIAIFSQVPSKDSILVRTAIWLIPEFC